MRLVATPGIQIRLWKHFFTPAANTETGAQRGCAISTPEDAQIQTAQANWPCLEQGVGLGDSRGPFQPQSFCNSVTVSFLTLLGACLHFKSRSKASTKAEWVFPAVRSLANTRRTYQLSTLHLAKLNPVSSGSPPALCGHKQDRGPAFFCISFPLCIGCRCTLPDQTPDLPFCPLGWQGWTPEGHSHPALLRETHALP